MGGTKKRREALEGREGKGGKCEGRETQREGKVGKGFMDYI